MDIKGTFASFIPSSSIAAGFIRIPFLLTFLLVLRLVLPVPYRTLPTEILIIGLVPKTKLLHSSMHCLSTLDHEFCYRVDELQEMIYLGATVIARQNNAQTHIGNIGIYRTTATVSSS